MTFIAECTGCIVLIILAAALFFFFIRFYSLRLRMFDSRLTGFIVISTDNCDAEIVLRDLMAYIRYNEINCFRKIYIKMDNYDERIYKVCQKICEEYPLFEMFVSDL